MINVQYAIFKIDILYRQSTKFTNPLAGFKQNQHPVVISAEVTLSLTTTVAN
jgi:hypothetical protein